MEGHFTSAGDPCIERHDVGGDHRLCVQSTDLWTDQRGQPSW